MNGTECLYIVEKDAGDLLAEILMTVDKSKPLVVNFSGIVNIDDHALDKIFSILNENGQTLIIIEGFHLVDTIHRLKKDSTANIESTSENEVIIIGKRFKVDFLQLSDERSQAKKLLIKKTVEDSFRKFKTERRLSSTPIIATGEFDSNYILSKPRLFIWMTMFLSDKLREILDVSLLTNVRLLCASLRASPFTSMLGIIHNLAYETIDHFGPKYKVLEISDSDKIEKGINYIYIGDFCFGATEIKIAGVYARMNFCQMPHALVIGNIIDPDVFSEDFKLSSLVDLKELDTEAIYKLIWE